MSLLHRLSLAARTAATVCGVLVFGSLQTAFAAGSGSALVSAGDVSVKASERYQAGSLHRFTFGGGYRDLWGAQITLPVVDLSATGGGLTPIGRFGGLQTAVLAFEGADGMRYTFRGTDKDPSAVLDPMLRETSIRALVQDQMAAQHPGGPVVAGVLSKALGVLTIVEEMAVMPDDPALGPYRNEFAGMVGTFYRYPTPATDEVAGFHGATEIIGEEALYDRLRASPAERVDARAFLRARLLDLLIGDFDRHRKQWRWAKIPGRSGWQPIPEDRDQAFVRYDGVGQGIGAVYITILQCYSDDFPTIDGLTQHGWEQDRWLLTELNWPAWRAVARDVQRLITDEVIERAVNAQPKAYVQLEGERLATALRGRRDKLVREARVFYRHLAENVDLHGTDEAEHVDVVWRGPMMEVTIRAASAPDGATPRVSRRFHRRDTEDVRVYLRGGNDVVRVRGEPGEVRLRLIAESRGKQIDDPAGFARLYGRSDWFKSPSGGSLDVINDRYVLPPSDAGFVDVDNVPPRDWGSDFVPFPIIGAESDLGFLIGFGGVHTSYGFRKHPWAARHRLNAAFATGPQAPIASYHGQFRPENSTHVARVDTRFSGMDVTRFYGFGNDTRADRADANYRVRNLAAELAPGFEFRFLDDRLRLRSSVWARYSSTTEGDRLIDRVAPYGAGDFGYVGVDVALTLDLRRSLWDDATLVLPFNDNPAAGYPTSGFTFEAAGQLVPPLWDSASTWGTLSGAAAGYVSVGDGSLALSARVGAKTTFGDVPFFAAAYLGGGSLFGGDTTARGYSAQRFAGDRSVYANLDARLFLSRVTLFLPGDLGIHAFGDVGRVFVDGERSSDWHPSVGGGIWFSPLVRTNTIGFTVAASAEDLLYYLRVGLHY